MIRNIFYALFLLGLSGCSKITVENPTDKFQAGKKLTHLNDKRLREISGGVSSISNQNLFWFHNDSGNDAEIFLVNDKLEIVLTCRLGNVDNRDWEDIAVGPGPEDGKNYIYIGEIGDNKGKFRFKFIYRMEEPKWDGHASNITINSFDTITFHLPDKKKDTETLLLDPVSKDLYVISKREDPVWVYLLKYPQSSHDTIRAEKLLSLPYTQIVGGDFSPDGRKLLLKNYEHIFYWERTGRKGWEDVLKEKPFEVPYELEPQGETIFWSRDNSNFYTLSEINLGKKSYLYYYKSRE